MHRRAHCFEISGINKDILLNLPTAIGFWSEAAKSFSFIYKQPQAFWRLIFSSHFENFSTVVLNQLKEQKFFLYLISGLAIAELAVKISNVRTLVRIYELWFEFILKFELVSVFSLEKYILKW